MNPEDVKKFLKTPGHDGPALCMEAGVLSRARYVSLSYFQTNLTEF